MYNTTESIEQAIKGYEQSDNVLDIENYPCNGNCYQSDTYIDVLNGGSIGIIEDLDYLIPINENLDYEVSILVEDLDVGVDVGVLNLGVRGFTSKDFLNEVSFYNSKDNTESNNFLEDFSLKVSRQEYWIRGILRSSSNKGSSNVNDFPSFGFGNNLIIEDGTKYVLLTFENNSSTEEFAIRGFHIKPLYLPNNASRGVLGMRNLFYFWLKNNSNNTNVKVTNAIGKEILPYSSLSEIQYLE